MAHPIYKNAEGKRLPSVTTIIGRFKDSGGFVHWAWDLGIQGIDYRKVRDAAADAGTIAHHLVEADIRTGEGEYEYIKGTGLIKID